MGHCGQTVKLLSKFSNFYRVKLLSFNTSLFLEKQDIDKLSFSDSVVKSSHYIRIIPENLGFPGGSDSKESACNVGDLGSIPGLRRSPGTGHGNPLQYSCLENPHGQRSLAGCSPWDCKKSDTTEQLSLLL